MKTNIIKEHNVTLHGALREHTIILRPLSDDHLPLLYKWNTDPEVLYWNEGPDADPNDNGDEAVRSIYKQTSNAGYCFILEIDGTAIGECLLCKMNVDYILEIYPTSADVRRIDILIGEKPYWNRGIGSVVVQMLVNLAFNNEKADIIYGITGDYNKRSGRIFQKNGFHLFLERPDKHFKTTDNGPEKTGLEVHYRLTRDEYKNR
ncbi:MAG: GNAT family N-acetyltransferase [Defluviitaleaceae bacterium]|nr:GNAT family N-acetyltransferase [Defluviitaleaceae bacterium]